MYDSNLKRKWDNKNVVDYARQEGMEKGKHEEAITIAKEMKKDGLPFSQISKFTKLSIEEIEKL
ncbi:MAG TPA: hypothetical protein VIM16_24010 [Mucilaginibacter sp.]|jgi:predicted transposase/invertase (TIGR01784 family)